jgi:thiol-disulfide isomerase/thioredoxin
VLALLPVVAEDSPSKQQPASVARAYQALTDEYQKALKASDLVFEKARTKGERQKIRAGFHQVRCKLVDRFLAFAERHPRDKESVAALFFVLHPDIHAERPAADRAIRLFLKDHLTSDRIVSLVRLLADQDLPISEEPLRAVLKKNPHRQVQAHACVSLALVLKRKADRSRPEQAALLTTEAEQLFERVARKYADVKSAASVARAELFQIQHLAIGKTMPDIRGTDGDNKEFKLSDYRGKVVVLSFWATWCKACMDLVPHERSLVKRLEGKPFALLGVNLDASRDVLKKSEEKHRITWRSFFDGRDGPISKQHNLESMPTIYVLDAMGVIRYKGVRGEALDRAVDLLLAEREKRVTK